MYRGCTLSFRAFTEEDYARIKSWGCDAVLYSIWWSKFEPYEDQIGVYDQDNIDFLKSQIAMARRHGLKTVISMRPAWGSDPQSWQGWSSFLGFNYVFFDEQGRQRYCNMLKKVAETFDIDALCPVHFPYHRYAETDEEKENYYRVAFPAFLNAIRDVSNIPVIFSPVNQGVGYVNGDRLTTGEYTRLTPYADPNIIYNINSHDAEYWKIAGMGEAWDGNLARLNEHFQPAVDFKNAYNIPLISIENISLDIHSRNPQRPIEQSRLAWAEAILKKQQELDISWFYWRYENPPTNQSPIEADGSDNAVAQLIMKYAPTPLIDLPVIAAGAIVTVDVALVAIYLATIFGYI